MREIKFRVWDKDSKEMYYPTTDLCIDWDKYSGSKLLCEIATENGSRACSDIEYEIMQFTGLRDKNGKDVYDGDIVKFSYCGEERIEPVISYPSITYVGRQLNFYAHIMFSATEPFQAEIIGNIHQNTELVNPPAVSPALNTMNNFDPKEGQAAEATTGEQAAQESASQDQAMEVDSEEGGTQG